MLGAALIALVILVVIPVAVAMTGAVVAAILGWALTEHAEATHAGSELVELS